jgi:hypothetical protein
MRRKSFNLLNALSMSQHMYDATIAASSARLNIARRTQRSFPTALASQACIGPIR